MATNRCTAALMRRRTCILLSRLCPNHFTHNSNSNSRLVSSVSKFIDCDSAPQVRPSSRVPGAQGGFLLASLVPRPSFIFLRQYVKLSGSGSSGGGVQCSLPHYYSFSRGILLYQFGWFYAYIYIGR